MPQEGPERGKWSLLYATERSKGTMGYRVVPLTDLSEISTPSRFS